MRTSCGANISMRLLQCVEVSVHGAEVDDAAIYHRRGHDGADGDESVRIHVHVLEVAEERRERLLVDAAVRVEHLEWIALRRLGLEFPRQRSRLRVDGVELPVV